MNIAMLFHSITTSALRRIRAWSMRRSAMQWHTSSPKPAEYIDSHQSAGPYATPALDAPYRFASRRPLRVLRVLEVGQPHSTVGRMVISGCMADVCAELGRLAEREATLL